MSGPSSKIPMNWTCGARHSFAILFPDLKYAEPRKGEGRKIN